MVLDIDDKSGMGFDHRDLIKRVVKACLAAAGAGDGVEISVVIANNRQIRKLNAKYMGVSRATDVLSFPLEDGPSPVLAGGGENDVALGDIVISYERALKQARDYGHSVEREIGFLAAHGTLHLLGHDHESPDDMEAMFGLQDAVLNGMGLRR